MIFCSEIGRDSEELLVLLVILEFNVGFAYLCLGSSCSQREMVRNEEPAMFGGTGKVFRDS